MKILLIFGTLDRPETFILKEFEKMGVDFDVLCDTAGGFYNLLADSKIKAEHLVCRNRLDPRAIFQVRRKLKQGNYDVVHVHTSRNLSVALFATMRLKKRPKIIAYRGAIGHVKAYDPTSWLTYLNPRVDVINCVSHAVKNYLENQGVSQKKLITVYKGHNPSIYSAAERTLLRDYRIPDDAFIVACVANMRKEKGIDTLLLAARKLAKHKDIHYLLVGEVRDEFLYEMSEHPDINGRVHFTGWTEKAPALSGLADVFVMPSRDREGLPKAVIEAMAQEKPVVVTSVGGMPELVRNLREGLVVPPDHPNALANAIEALYVSKELRERLGKAGKKKIYSEFTVQQTALETLSLYENVVEQDQEPIRANQF